MISPKVIVRRLRFWWRLLFAYARRYKIWLLAFFFVGSIGTYSAVKIFDNVIRHDIITIGYVGSYTIENVPSQVLSLVTQPLISPDENGLPRPSLASHWTVSEDGKTYIVFLNDNLKWHDTSDVDAKDISIAIKNVEITALNNKAIQFNLPNPIVSFPLALDKPVFKAKSFYGTGQFRIVDIDRIGSVVKKISLISKNKDLPRVEINFYQTEEQAANALKIGEIKSATIANSNIFTSWPNLEVERKVANDETVTIFFNNEDPLLSSKELRQALSFAINKADFDGVEANGPVPSSNWVYNQNVKRYDFNSAKAKELITDAKIDSQHVTLSVIAGQEEVAESIKRDWEAVGIDTEIKVEKTIPENFQALLVINKLQPDPDQYSLWHSTQIATNIAKYKNVKIDKLLEDARSEQDQEKRKILYLDFQRFLVEDAPATFLFHPYKHTVMYKNVKDLLAKLPVQ